jgi:hypothetical protein
MYTEWVYGAFKGDDDKDLMWAQYDAYRHDRIAWHLFETARQAIYDAKNKVGHGINVPLLADAKDVQSLSKKALWSTCDAIAAYYRYCQRDSESPVLSKDSDTWRNILRRQYVIYFKAEVERLCDCTPFAKQVVICVTEDFEDEGHEARLKVQELLDDCYGNAYWSRRRSDAELFEKDLGYIYVLSNPSMDNLVKIGKTSRDPSSRATELSSASGVPGKFVVVHSVWALNIEVAEDKVHNKLEDHRYNQRREFFEIDVKKAIEMVDEVVDDVNSRVSA